MKQFQAGFVIYLAVIVVGLLLAGTSAYFYFKDDEIESVKINPRLELETEKLVELKKRYDSEKFLISKLKREYTAVENNIFARTDIFFDKTNLNNPQIKIGVKDKLTLQINNQYWQIKKMIADWQKKMTLIDSLSSLTVLPPSLAELIKNANNDFAYIQKYLANLKLVINNLTTVNSGLSQVEIDKYKSLIDELTGQIGVSITSIQNITTSAGLSTNSSSGSSSSGGNSSIVTIADIQNQEKVVEEIKNGEGTNNPDPVPENPIPPTQTISTTSPNPVVVPISRPGKPILIEGANKY